MYTSVISRVSIIMFRYPEIGNHISGVLFATVNYKQTVICGLLTFPNYQIKKALLYNMSWKNRFPDVLSTIAYNCGSFLERKEKQEKITIKLQAPTQLPGFNYFMMSFAQTC